MGIRDLIALTGLVLMFGMVAYLVWTIISSIEEERKNFV